MAKVKKKKQVRKIYIYNYQDNKELGERLKGMSGFIANQMLKNKYSQSMVCAVMAGTRKNDEILAAMKTLDELNKPENF